MTAEQPEDRVEALYRHPYPSPELAGRHPFVEHDHEFVDEAGMRRRAEAFLESAERRRSVLKTDAGGDVRHDVRRDTRE